MIVHFSNSPLSGAVSNLVNALNSIGIDSLLIHTPHIQDTMLTLNATTFIDNYEKSLMNILKISSKSKIIFHIHNWLPYEIESIISHISGLHSIYVIRHFHQALNEHPVYYHSIDEDFVNEYVVVSHGFARTFKNVKFLPNVSRTNILNIKTNHTKPLKILFTPSSRKQTRWGGKSNSNFNKILNLIKYNKNFKLFIFEGLSPNKIDSFRNFADITLDEVVTGCFHLVSYEGLYFGNVVINNADLISLDIFAESISSNIHPPFLISNENELYDKLIYLSQNDSLVNDFKEQGKSFFTKYLNPNRIANIYKNFYDSI